MLYEIKSYEKLSTGNEYNYSFITDSFEFVNVKKGACVKFKVDGKKNAQYVLTERKAFHREFETVITEATTGRVLYRFN